MHAYAYKVDRLLGSGDRNHYYFFLSFLNVLCIFKPIHAHRMLGNCGNHIVHKRGNCFAFCCCCHRLLNSIETNKLPVKGYGNRNLTMSIHMNKQISYKLKGQCNVYEAMQVSLFNCVINMSCCIMSCNVQHDM